MGFSKYKKILLIMIVAFCGLSLNGCKEDKSEKTAPSKYKVELKSTDQNKPCHFGDNVSSACLDKELCHDPQPNPVLDGVSEVHVIIKENVPGTFEKKSLQNFPSYLTPENIASLANKELTERYERLPKNIKENTSSGCYGRRGQTVYSYIYEMDRGKREFEDGLVNPKILNVLINVGPGQDMAEGKVGFVFSITYYKASIPNSILTGYSGYFVMPKEEHSFNETFGRFIRKGIF